MDTRRRFPGRRFPGRVRGERRMRNAGNPQRRMAAATPPPEPVTDRADCAESLRWADANPPPPSRCRIVRIALTQRRCRPRLPRAARLRKQNHSQSCNLGKRPLRFDACGHAPSKHAALLRYSVTPSLRHSVTPSLRRRVARCAPSPPEHDPDAHEHQQQRRESYLPDIAFKRRQIASEDVAE